MKFKSYLMCLIFLSLFACAEIGQDAKSRFQEKIFDGDYRPELVNEAEAFGESVISQSTEDFCEQLNWYGDGYCDTYCSQPDPDCNKEVASPWVNQDGDQVINDSSQAQNPWLDPNAQTEIDEETQAPDQQAPDQQVPDQQVPDQQESDQQESWHEESDQQESFDQCMIEADDFCDESCPADIDCDLCAQYGFYGDGYCDEDCSQPDIDCL
jgi:hypothetical protein